MENQQLEGWVELLRSAVVLVNREGLAVNMNASARELLSRTSIIRLESNRLRASRDADQRRLDQCLGTRASDSREIKALRFRGVDNGESLALLIAGLPPPFDESRACTAIFLSDGECSISTVTGEHLQQLWNLTEAEGRVAAAIASGVSLQRFAKESGTSLHTVRSQLKSVFAKTGTRRQADLVRIVLLGPGYVRSHQD